jgi:ABC-type polysaccharide/polyol phosphate export permease
MDTLHPSSAGINIDDQIILLIMEFKRILGTSYSLGIAHFKLRNEGSYLGIFWYLLNPILMFLLLLAIFSNSLGEDIENYPLYLLLGIIMFNFFQAVTSESTKIMRRDRNVIRSIKFPLESMVGNIVLVSIFSHFFEMLILIIVLLILKMPLLGLIVYPIILLVFSLFSLGVSLILSSIAVYFVDLDNIWIFASRLLWMATPIFYTFEKGSILFIMNRLNPLYYFITLTRHIVVYNELPPLLIIMGTLEFTAVSILWGMVIFRRSSKKFAEMV